MMKNIFIFLLLNFFVTENLFAQKENRNWVFGDSVRVDFNNLSNPTVHHANCYNNESNASISNPNGSLLMYLNTQDYWSGQDKYCEIMNKQNNLMENGDSVSHLYTSTNGALFLPIPNDSNKYYFFSIAVNLSLGYFLSYSTIDKSFNSGLGKVISKNIFLEDSLIESMTTIRHANGRDWWVIVHKRNSNKFSKFLITPSGISVPSYQNIGSAFYAQPGECSASAIGNKICWVSSNRNLDVFDFDRCTGELSNWLELGIPPYNQPDPNGMIYYGCEFSPDATKIYISKILGNPARTNIFQYTLDAVSAINSKTDILPLTSGLALYQFELGPDNKIYLAGAPDAGTIDSSFKYLSVIENPNDSGIACNLNLYSLYLNGRYTTYGIPNMPNYNLSALDGSACDTLGIDAPNNVVEIISNTDFNVFPNPTDGNFTITTSITIQQIEVINLLGEKVYSLRCNTPTQTLHLTTLSKGVYFIRLKTKNGLVMKKVVVE